MNEGQGAMNKILVVLGSETGDRAAVERLIELGRGGAESLLLAIVHEAALDGYLGNTEIYARLRKRLVDEKTAEIEAIAKGVAKRRVACAAKAVWAWPRGEAIQREAGAFGADLVVLSFGIEPKRQMSSRDWRFLAECPLPVLVVNRDASEPYRHVVAAVDPVHAHAKPAELDASVVAVAQAVAMRTGAELTLVHAFRPLAHYHVDLEGVERVPLEDAEAFLEASRRQALESLAAQAGLDASVAKLMEGGPEEALARLAERGEADLIVMGALSRGKLADLIIGSTAERVLERPGADILLVKPPEPPA